MQYHRRKWGGDGDHEQYVHPFAEPRIGIRIAPERQQRPVWRAL
jgi:hypothetical protein